MITGGSCVRRALPIALALALLGLGGCGGQSRARSAPPSQGERTFASSGCGNCHTLRVAGASGMVGPDLDRVKPSPREAIEQVRDGGGAMPAYGGQLSAEEIRAVASFVVSATRSGQTER